MEAVQKKSEEAVVEEEKKEALNLKMNLLWQWVEQPLMMAFVQNH